jgi:hypothetical protein
LVSKHAIDAAKARAIGVHALNQPEAHENGAHIVVHGRFTMDRWI